MSAPFRRHAAVGAHTEPPVEAAPRTAGGRLDVPLRIAASLDPASPESPKVGGSDPVPRLAMVSIEVSGDRSAEDMVADAIDRLPWTAVFMDAARDRRRRDALWRAAAEAVPSAKA